MVAERHFWSMAIVDKVSEEMVVWEELAVKSESILPEQDELD